MPQSISKALVLLRYANFIVVFGNGVTWTGLSYDLATKYEDPRFMAFIQILSVIASVLGPFLALWIHSRSQICSIFVGSELAATICCIIIFFLSHHHAGLEFYTIGMLGLPILMILLSSSISDLFIEPLYANLIEKRDGSDKEVKREFAVFASYGILSKLCGMSMGPFLFALLGQYSLLVNASSFLLSSLLLWVAMNNVPLDIGIIAVRPEQVTIFKKSTWAEIVKLPLLENAIANSLIFIVALTMSTQAMVLQASPAQLSFFWFGATGCAFLAHFSLSRFKTVAEFFFRLEKKFGFIQVVPVSLGLIMNNITILLISQWIFSLLNPLTTNQSRADFYRTYGRNSNSSLNAYAMRNILTQLIILIFSLFVSLAETKTHNLALAIPVMTLIVLRWGIATHIRVQKNYAETR